MKKAYALMLVIIFITSFCSCGNTDLKNTDIHFEDIREISELSTLKCYYNNVAQIEKKADTILQKDRKMWIEYEGIANIGVNLSESEMKVNGNIITIDLPKAEILSISPVKETLSEKSYVVSQDRLIFKNKIAVEDQEAAIKAGQEEMKSSIMENSSLFIKAENKAKELIENYINEIGKLTETEYIINWE